MLTVFIISLVLFLSYVIGICVLNKKIPQSISDSFYILESKIKNLGWLFTLFCWGVLFTIVPIMFEITEGKGNYHSLAFLAGVGLGLVGAAPHFKHAEKSIHYVGAVICLLFSQIWCLKTMNEIPIIVWSVYAVSTVIWVIRHDTDIIDKKFSESKPLFWIEIAAFVSTYITIGLCMI